MIAPAITRKLKVDPLMRTTDVEVSVGVKLGSVPQQLNTLAQNVLPVSTEAVSMRSASRTVTFSFGNFELSAYPAALC